MSNLDWEPQPEKDIDWFMWLLIGLIVLGLCVGPFLIG